MIVFSAKLMHYKEALVQRTWRPNIGRADGHDVGRWVSGPRVVVGLGTDPQSFRTGATSHLALGPMSIEGRPIVLFWFLRTDPSVFFYFAWTPKDIRHLRAYLEFTA